MAQPPVTVAAATRPYPGETANGDSWQVDWHGDQCRIALIDGLGHGPDAAAAAAVACRVLSSHTDLAPEQALRACHAALHGSRGAAMAIAAIDLAGASLTYSGVGNTEAYLCQNEHAERLIAYRGIIGGTLPTLRSFYFQLRTDWALLMHTDGIRSRFQINAVGDTGWANPQALAEGILRTWGRPTDDATVVVARPHAALP